MRSSIGTIARTLAFAGVALGASVAVAVAGPLMDRIKEGKSIRIGFANEVPLAYPGTNGEPDGFVNPSVIDLLKQMGYTDIEPVQTDWGGLIPGLQANRFDIITGGMYILKQRCESVLFSEPMAEVSDVFIVPKGNPKGIQTYADLAEKNAVMAGCTGCNTLADAKAAGVSPDHILALPQMEDMLAAVSSGRADAAAGPYFTMQNFANNSHGAVELTDASKMPESSKNWSSMVFRKDDADFVKAFDEAQKSYLGTPEMLETVASYGYGKTNLPSKSTEWICQNR
ncbi:MAG: ectoine/hydroxyectoine ABC transporter substrate-binding protein EhuB [Parvibaculaceae bacterium]